MAKLPRSEWPTGMGAPTVLGTVLGTPHYMAPEQAEGKVDALDARTDIFAFGAVIYEMATGKKAFQGESQASISAAILKEDPPPLSSLDPPGKLSSPALDHLVKTCLAKDPEERWQTAHDITKQLQWIAQAGSQASAASAAAIAPARSRRRWILAAGLACLIAAALAGIATWSLKPAPPLPVTRTVIALPPASGWLRSTSPLSPSPRTGRISFTLRFRAATAMERPVRAPTVSEGPIQPPSRGRSLTVAARIRAEPNSFSCARSTAWSQSPSRGRREQWLRSSRRTASGS